MLNGLDLFSGIGGIAIALSNWVEPIAYCENDRYAQSVILSRIQGGKLPNAPIWDDVRTLTGAMLPSIDIIYGGFPCQDISAAGRGAGLAGERSGLYWEIHRIARECIPQFIFLENVPAIRTRGLTEVVRSLSEIGYDCRWCTISAASIGAPHLRNRWFLLASHRKYGSRKSTANANGIGVRDELWRGEWTDGEEAPGPFDYGQTKSMAISTSSVRPRVGTQPGGESNGLADSGETVADPNGERGGKGWTRTPLWEWRYDLIVGGARVANSMRAGRNGKGSVRSRKAERTGPRDQSPRSSWWATEPDVGRVAHGVPFRVDRIKGLGNSVVPAQAKAAFEILMGMK